MFLSCKLEKKTFFFPIVLVATNHHFKETCDNTSLDSMSQKSGLENRHASQRQGYGAKFHYLLLPQRQQVHIGIYISYISDLFKIALVLLSAISSVLLS